MPTRNNTGDSPRRKDRSAAKQRRLLAKLHLMVHPGTIEHLLLHLNFLPVNEAVLLAAISRQISDALQLDGMNDPEEEKRVDKWGFMEHPTKDLSQKLHFTESRQRRTLKRLIDRDLVWREMRGSPPRRFLSVNWPLLRKLEEDAYLAENLNEEVGL